MAEDLPLGRWIWFPDSVGDILAYRVRFIHMARFEQGSKCRNCWQAELTKIGTVIERLWHDYKLYTVTFCEHCQGVTVFISFKDENEMEVPPYGYDQPNQDI